MNRLTKFAVTGFTAASLAVAGLGGMAAGAAPAFAATTSSQAASQVSKAQDLTFGYRVYNLTGSDIKYVGSTNDSPMTGPSDGTVLHPGTFADFELTYTVQTTTWRNLWFHELDANGNDTGATFAVNIANNGTQLGDNIPSAGGTAPVNQQLNVVPQHGSGNNWTTVQMIDTPGTTYTMTDPKEQGEVLSTLCANGAQATCTFTPTSETHVAGPQHELAAANNNSSLTDELTVHQEDEVEQEDSVEVGASVEAEIAGIAKVAVEAKYGHEWTTSHAFAVDYEVEVAPHTRGEIDGVAPMIKDTGTYVIKIGNTTYNLPNVSFESPDPDGHYEYAHSSTPLTPQEQASLPKTFQNLPVKP